LAELVTGVRTGARAEPETALPAIRLDHVSKWFFKNGKRFIALDDITADIPEGAFITLVGPSGCGKTTIFNMIAGFARADRGAVICRGETITRPNIGIGYMTQKDALLPWRSVLANVTLPLYLQKVPAIEARARALDMLARVGLKSFAEHLPRELSGGMQKRAALARTLVFNPAILLMDEPFGNVDIQLKLQLQRELMGLWESSRKTVVFVTHDLEEAIALADRVCVLTARPATLKKVYEIDLPRPRVTSEIRYHPRFVEISRDIWHDLREEVQIA